jgi:hypothetical protein
VQAAGVAAVGRPGGPIRGRGDGRLGATASVVATTAMDRNKVAMSWLRPVEALLAASGRAEGPWTGRARRRGPPSFVETLR